MTVIGYHASHEQFTPKDLVGFTQAAEQAGFGAVMSSDHFAPWSERQGQAGFAWSWLGAAMQATKIPFGLITVPSGWRYHPAIIAQAGATLAQMFPDRLNWMALGSGQALNERIMGEHWPEKTLRNERLLAGAQIIEALWAGEVVSQTAPIRVQEARLYTLPEKPPTLIAGALSPATAQWAGGWANGLITVNQPIENLRQIIDAFRRGGGKGKPLYLQLHVSYAGTEDEARANAFDQWRSNAIAAPIAETLLSPEQFDAASTCVRPEDLDKHVRISADPGRHRAWIEEYLELGFEQIYVHNVGRNQSEFIEVFGAEVVGEV